MSINRRWAWSWVANYRGATGQWAWVLHRITGLLIVLFLLLHIADTSLVGWGPGVYDGFSAIYHNPIVRVFEVILVGIVIYHALNGIRISIIDFWDRGSLYQERIFWGSVLLFFVLFIPSAYLMLASVF